MTEVSQAALIKLARINAASAVDAFGPPVEGEGLTDVHVGVVDLAPDHPSA
jgi:hypothetical protein